MSEFDWTPGADGLRFTIQPPARKTADESVGLVLLPVLIVLVVVSGGYLLAVLGIALAGRDPAMVLAGAQPGFVALGAITWAASTARYRQTHRPEQPPALSVICAPGALTLRDASGATRWRLSTAQLDRAEVRSDPTLRVRVLTVDGDPREIPMTDEAAAGWLAADLNQRLGAARARAEPTADTEE